MRRIQHWLNEQAAGPRRAVLFGAALGVLYGVIGRLLFATDGFTQFGFMIMSYSFICVVPFVLGYLSVLPAAKPGWLYRIFVPWLPTLAATAASMLLGWEGAICVIFGLPIMLPVSSLGGIIAGFERMRGLRHAGALALLPFLTAPLESRIEAPVRVQENVTEIMIDAPADAVWAEVATVPPILEHEQRDALYLRLGFPRPISAELTRPGIGGVRHARFEGNVLFVETITAWEEGRRIAFTIDAQEDSIPPTTLDPHVTIGGPYFDVLQGEYRLYPLPDGRTRVVLTSRHRLSTTFNAYSALWAGAVMRSIQDNILQVVKERAES